MTDKQETNHAFARSRSNAGLGGELTHSQKECLEQLRKEDRWVYVVCENPELRKSVLDPLLEGGLVEHECGYYRAMPNIE